MKFKKDEENQYVGSEFLKSDIVQMQTQDSGQLDLSIHDFLKDSFLASNH